MSNGFEKVANGVSVVAKVIVSLLWAGGGAVCFAAHAWLGGILAIAYLTYLWVFGGRWLVY